MSRFPHWSREHLERVATEHALLIAVERGQEPSEAPLDRLVVNMLRHEFTDYDDDPTAERRKASCFAIAARYPWLADECARQIARRAEAENLEAGLLAMAEVQSEEDRRWRAQRVSESHTAIRALSIGSRVTARVAGVDRACVITWVGRSKVEVVYQIKSGDERRKRIYARDVALEPVG